MSFLTQLFDPSLRFEHQYAEYLLERFRFLSYRVHGFRWSRVARAPRSAERACVEHAVVLTGAPGAGKTTTLAYLAISNAYAALKDRRARLPLFFAGRDIATLPRITDLPRGLNLSEAVANGCPRIFFADLFTSRRALILIDDADQLPPGLLSACEHEYKDAQIIATAQTALPGFEQFPLPGLRDYDIDRFIKNWTVRTQLISSQH